MVPYTSGIGAGLSSTWFPPSIEVAEQCSWVRCLKRSVEESREKCMLQRGLAQCAACGNSCNMRNFWISRRGHHFRGLSGVTLSSAPTGVRTLTTGKPLHQNQRSWVSWPLDHQSSALYFRDRGRAFLHRIHCSSNLHGFFYNCSSGEKTDFMQDVKNNN